MADDVAGAVGAGAGAGAGLSSSARDVVAGVTNHNNNNASLLGKRRLQGLHQRRLSVAGGPSVAVVDLKAETLKAARLSKEGLEAAKTATCKLEFAIRTNVSYSDIPLLPDCLHLHSEPGHHATSCELCKVADKTCYGCIGDGDASSVVFLEDARKFYQGTRNAPENLVDMCEEVGAYMEARKKTEAAAKRVVVMTAARKLAPRVYGLVNRSRQLITDVKKLRRGGWMLQEARRMHLSSQHSQAEDNAKTDEERRRLREEWANRREEPNEVETFVDTSTLGLLRRLTAVMDSCKKKAVEVVANVRRGKTMRMSATDDAANIRVAAENVPETVSAALGTVADFVSDKGAIRADTDTIRFVSMKAAQLDTLEAEYNFAREIYDEALEEFKALVRSSERPAWEVETYGDIPTEDEAFFEYFEVSDYDNDEESGWALPDTGDLAFRRYHDVHCLCPTCRYF
ncbi:hypothetical protein RI054_42g149700 [Pseudoscourfieldia marina]